MCRGNRTGSLGNSAAVHAVVLVNFIMQVSAFSPSTYFMLIFWLSRHADQTRATPGSSVSGVDIEVFSPHSHFFPHRGFIVSARFFSLGYVRHIKN